MNKEAPKTEEKINREYPDNHLVSELVGPQNSNLDKIEKEMGVTLQSIGNQMTIRGTAEAAKGAAQVLDSLYDRLKKGKHIENADIEAAIRMSATPKSEEDLTLRTRKRHISPRSAMQAEYIRSMKQSELVFGLGPAGTGKTYLAVAMAVSLMVEGKIDRIILSRPAVEAGEHLGFLPGDMKDKVDPYLRPLYDALFDMLPEDMVNKKLETGEIEVAPLAFMRGRTLSNAAVILDEAQNTTPMQMKMFLTRLGENSRMVINGDLSQTDLPPNTVSGLSDALSILRNVPGIGMTTFTENDVVRHGLVARIVKAYDERMRKRDEAMGKV